MLSHTQYSCQVSTWLSLTSWKPVFCFLFKCNCYKISWALTLSGIFMLGGSYCNMWLTCWAFLLSVVALRRFSAPSLIFSSLRISRRILSRCSSRSCCTLESEKSEFWSRPSCSRTDSPPGSLWMGVNKEGGKGRTKDKEVRQCCCE